METVNLVNTIAKVATSKASNVAVSKDSVIAQNVSLQPEMGESLPENEAKSLPSKLDLRTPSLCYEPKW